MLTVDLKKGKDIDKLWYKGMFRTSVDNSLVIMVVEDVYSGRELSALILRDLKNKGSELNVDGSGAEFWIEQCPVVIEDTDLILKGTVE